MKGMSRIDYDKSTKQIAKYAGGEGNILSESDAPVRCNCGSC